MHRRVETMSKRKKLSYERKKARYGYVFISIWLVGFILFFVFPFIQSSIYSFSRMQIRPGNIEMEFIGWENYSRAFLEDSRFLPAFTSTITSVLAKTPLIIVFSMFIASLLNQKFKGRFLIRSVFFLPVIISSGVVINIISGDAFLNLLMTGERSSLMFEANSMQSILYAMGLDTVIVNFIINTVNEIFNLSWRSGIQILIFLAGLQSISSSYYEVALVEGATGWEIFWKVTFPMIAPMILVNIIYTLIDNFIDVSNPMFALIQTITGRIDFAYAAALSMVNFIVIFVLIGIIYGLINRRIYYAVD